MMDTATLKYFTRRVELLRLLAGLMLVSPLGAQTFSGVFTEMDPSPYAGIPSQYVATSLSVGGNVNTAWEGGQAFCLDYEAKSLSQDTDWSPPADNFSGDVVDIRDVEAWTRFSTDRDVGLVVAQISFAVDQYYYDSVLPEGVLERRAFAYVIWEIMYDGGTEDGFDVTSGNFSSGTGDAPKSLATKWLDEIAAAGVKESYQRQANWIVIDDSRAEYQDYILLGATPVPVPEPSAGLMIFLFAGMVLVGRRSRG